MVSPQALGFIWKDIRSIVDGVQFNRLRLDNVLEKLQRMKERINDGGQDMESVKKMLESVQTQVDGIEKRLVDRNVWTYVQSFFLQNWDEKYISIIENTLNEIEKDFRDNNFRLTSRAREAQFDVEIQRLFRRFRKYLLGLLIFFLILGIVLLYLLRMSMRDLIQFKSLGEDWEIIHKVRNLCEAAMKRSNLCACEDSEEI
uniref:Uncharacterized protein n=1 Tax=Compsopogon caeruleus TaxID=31354 RepID=A0A7S1T7G0_9RHOD|mmetsp:Transcript_11873/g.24194  ORF Transcript_11873/g.24194 Transcript_11873/m.24194 type:complete len:201 (+) Transcript_11873:2-604(+)